MVQQSGLQTVSKSLPIGWVSRGRERTIVGYLGNIPLFYELEGRRLLASVAHAWVTDAAIGATRSCC